MVAFPTAIIMVLHSSATVDRILSLSQVVAYVIFVVFPLVVKNFFHLRNIIVIL